MQAAVPATAAPAQSRAAPAISSAAVPVSMPWLFMLGIPLTSLLLQRFAFPLAGWQISLETPIGLGLAAWGLFTGTLAFDRRRLVLLLGLAIVGLFATVIDNNLRIAIAPPPSLGSLVNWLTITAFVALTFREAVPEERLFRFVNACLAGIAIAGIAQFAAQFAGLKLFTFEGFVPSRFLMEKGYFNTSNPIFYGSAVMRANGGFLVEPSVFSQAMAVAIVIEMLYFRRAARLVLYLAGLLTSVAGSGWLVLITFMGQQVLSGSQRRLLTGLSLAGTATAALLIFALLVPQAAGVLLARSNEFGHSGSSGNERFVAPFIVMDHVLSMAPRVAFIGLGPGTSEHLAMHIDYSMNSPTKILLEYGTIGFGLYIALLVSARRTSRQRALLAPVLVLLLFDGNWCQFSPVLFLSMLLVTVAKLQEGSANDGSAVRHRP